MGQAKKDPFRLEYAVVYGETDFPFDMLRYDRCFPAGEEESPKLCHSDPMGVDRELHLRFVIVARYVAQPGGWTPERWKSFTWKLLGTFDSYEEARLGRDAQIAALKAAKSGKPA